MNKHFLLFLPFLFLTIALHAVAPGNDSLVNAFELTSLMDSNDGIWCSSDDSLLFSNIDAIADGVAPNCLHSLHYLTHNVWFSYQANSTRQLKFELKVNGLTNQLVNPYISLWQDTSSQSGVLALEELKCKKYTGANDDLSLSYTGLTTGEYYYISVQSGRSSDVGHFDVCMSDQSGFDEALGAFELTSLVDSNGGTWCSSDDSLQFSNIDASADGVAPNCLHSLHYLTHNVWFSYQANSTRQLKFELKVNGLTNQLMNPYISLWRDTSSQSGVLALEELKCKKYTGANDDLSLSYTGLTTGEYYYISVQSGRSSDVGHFDVCMSDQSGFDEALGAFELTSLVDSNGGTWCSSDDSLLFTNVDASGDGEAPSCLISGHYLTNNVWFKYEASATSQINFELEIDGLSNQLINPYLTLWRDTSSTSGVLQLEELKCRKYTGATDDLSLSYTVLETGSTYYISVQSGRTSDVGNFYVCISELSGFDEAGGAYDLTTKVSSNNGSWCSESDSLFFSNVDASGDGEAPSCLISGHYLTNNVWFKYEASVTGQINFELEIDGLSNQLVNPYLTLWRDTSSTSGVLQLEELKCRKYAGATDDLSLNYTGLVTGSTYYISVQSGRTSDVGNFHLCISDMVFNDFIDEAFDLTNILSSNNGFWCSQSESIIFTTTDATADGATPSCKHPSYPTHSNVWFKYQVGSSGEFNFEVKINGVTGLMQYPNLTLWRDTSTISGEIKLEEIMCRPYKGNIYNIGIGKGGLVEGDFYYVSVDPHTVSHTGNFYVCASDQVSFDFIEGAYDLTTNVSNNGGNWCSQDSSLLFTTVDATAVGATPSCKHPSYPTHSNVWFKYQVGSSGEFNFEVKINGVTGLMQYPNLALWRDTSTVSGEIKLEEIMCRPYKGNIYNIGIGKGGLVEGDFYYVSVDPHTVSFTGNFYVCASDQVSFDFIEGAYDLTTNVSNNGGNWCSQDSSLLFTTVDATADGVTPSCKNPSYPTHSNVWFKYQVGSSGEFNFEVKINGVTGGMKYPNLALWRDTSTISGEIKLEEIMCRPYKGNIYNLGIGKSGLVEGDIYYVSVDPHTVSFTGNFYICASDQVSFDFIEGAYDLTANVSNNGGNWCSQTDTIIFTTVDATADGVTPSCKHPSYPTHSNVWFEYQVGLSGEFNFEVKINGVTGLMQYPNLTLWRDTSTISGEIKLEEIMCRPYKGNIYNIGIGKGGLVEGNIYYVSVEPHTTSNLGNFYVCASDQVSFDFIEGAYDLTSATISSGGSWCSQDSSLLFTTVDATPDGTDFSCKLGSHPLNSNVWFKYLATGDGDIEFEVSSGGILGTLKYPYISVFRDTSNGAEISLEEIVCKKYTTSQGALRLDSVPVTKGQQYYLGLDPGSTNFGGTFSVCIETDLNSSIDTIPLPFEVVWVRTRDTIFVGPQDTTLNGFINDSTTQLNYNPDSYQGAQGGTAMASSLNTIMEGQTGSFQFEITSDFLSSNSIIALSLSNPCFYCSHISDKSVLTKIGTTLYTSYYDGTSMVEDMSLAISEGDIITLQKTAEGNNFYLNGNLINANTYPAPAGDLELRIVYYNSTNHLLPVFTSTHQEKQLNLEYAVEWTNQVNFAMPNDTTLVYDTLTSNPNEYYAVAVSKNELRDSLSGTLSFIVDDPDEAIGIRFINDQSDINSVTEADHVVIAISLAAVGWFLQVDTNVYFGNYGAVVQGDIIGITVSDSNQIDIYKNGILLTLNENLSAGMGDLNVQVWTYESNLYQNSFRASFEPVDQPSIISYPYDVVWQLADSSFMVDSFTLKNTFVLNEEENLVFIPSGDTMSDVKAGFATSLNVIQDGEDGEFLINLNNDLFSDVTFFTLTNSPTNYDLVNLTLVDEDLQLIALLGSNLAILDFVGDSMVLEFLAELDSDDQIELKKVNGEGLYVYVNSNLVKLDSIPIPSGNLQLKIIQLYEGSDTLEVPKPESSDPAKNQLPYSVEWQLGDTVVIDSTILINGLSFDLDKNLVFTPNAVPENTVLLGMAYSENYIPDEEPGEFVIDLNDDLLSDVALFTLSNNPTNFDIVQGSLFQEDLQLIAILGSNLAVLSFIEDSMVVEFLTTLTTKDQIVLKKVEGEGLYVYKNLNLVRLDSLPLPEGDLELKFVFPYEGNEVVSILKGQSSEPPIVSDRFYFPYHPDICFELGEVQCEGLVASLNPTNNDIIDQTVLVPIDVQGTEIGIPPDYLFEMRFDKELEFVRLNGSNLDYSVINIEEGLVEIQFNSATTFLALDNMEFVLDYDELEFNSNFTLRPFYVSNECSKDCGGENGCRYDIDIQTFILQPVINCGNNDIVACNPTIPDAGDPDEKRIDIVGNLNYQNIDRLMVAIENSSGVLDVYSLSNDDFLINPIGNSLYLEHLFEISGFPEKEAYKIIIHAVSDNDLIFKLEGFIPQQGGYAGTLIWPTYLLTGQAMPLCGEPLNLGVTYHDAMESTPNNEVMIDVVTSLNTVLLDLNGNPFYTLGNIGDFEHDETNSSVAGYKLYVDEYSESLNSTGRYKFKSEIKNNNDQKFKVEYDFIIECAKEP